MPSDFHTMYLFNRREEGSRREKLTKCARQRKKKKKEWKGQGKIKQIHTHIHNNSNNYIIFVRLV